ncbi:MAG: hypothetical protein ABI162_14940 [Luteolibacter sp.]
MSKNQFILGIVILLLGCGILAYEGFYVTKEESVLKVGPLDVKARTQERVPIPAPLGWICIVGGAIILIYGGLSKRA